MKRILSLILILTFIAAGCSFKPKEAVQQPTTQAVTPTATPTLQEPAPQDQNAKADNIFDGKQVKVGDTVAGMKIISLEIHPENGEDYDAYISFEGEATVSGKFKHMKDDEFLGDEIVFEVDKESESKLPKLQHDERYVWFTFTNRDAAEKALGPSGSGGTATVTIKNYGINYAHTEIWNTAELVKVEKVAQE